MPLTPPWSRVPRVHDTTDLLPDETMVAIKGYTLSPLTGFWVGTQAEYAALPTKVATILYLTTD